MSTTNSTASVSAQLSSALPSISVTLNVKACHVLCAWWHSTHDPVTLMPVELYMFKLAFTGPRFVKLQSLNNLL